MTNRTPQLIRAAFAALFGVLPLLVATAAFAADAKKPFDIPAGDALPALKQFAAQSGGQLLYSAEVVQGVTTNAIKGAFTAREALDAMVRGTNLTVVADRQNGALSLVRAADPNALRAAQSNSDRPTAPEKAELGLVKLGAFEVFDSKLINADIRRSRDDAQPYVVFNREQLQASPSTSLEDFFRARLPMNQTFGTSANSTVGVESNINLRGLGTNQTLILLDGRRLPPKGSVGGATSQSDINGIPLGMIERIEILPATASGIYGGSATGGVINIITRKDYAGVEVTATYQNAFDTDVATRRLDVNGSFALEGGRTQVTLNYSRADGTTLLVEDRDFAARSRALLLQNNPAAFTAGTTPPAGYLANIRSSTGANLVLKNGTALNSPITFVPAGYAGPASDGGAALVANAGRYDLNLPQAPFGAKAPLLSVPTTESFGLGLRRRFGSRVEAYVDAVQMKNDLVGTLPGNSTTTIAANAPNNPFTSAISVNFPNLAPDLPLVEVSRSDRLTAGAMLRLPADWSAGVDYVHSRSKFGYDIASAQLGDPDGTGPGLAYATALSNGTLNVLRDLYATPLDLRPYLMPDPFSRSRTKLTTQEWTLRGFGPLVRLPAGPLTLSASVQWREERISDFVSTNPSAASPTLTYNWNPAVGVKASAYYSELRVPIVSPASQIPLVRSLELQASVRLDEFTMHTRADRTNIVVSSPSGPFPAVTFLDRDFRATKATAGLKYTVTEDLALRASFGTGFLPPTLFQMSPAAPSTPAVTIIDPRRGNISQVISPLRLFGGNPDLEPEESESTSAGLVFTPRWAPGLRLSVDYTRIVKTNEIPASIAPQSLLNLETYFPDKVVRAPLTPADQALGYTGGVITQLDQRLLNLAGKRLEAWDLQVDYTWKPANWGEFQAYAIATWQPHLESQALIDAPWVENVGFMNSAIEWRGSGGLTWTRGAWTLGWNLQYTGSYFVYTATSAAAARVTSELNQGSATIPSQVYHDLSVSYRWGASPGGWQRLLAHSQLTLGVQNVFDTSPPILANLAPFGSAAYSTVGDPRLRRYTLSLRKKF